MQLFTLIKKIRSNKMTINQTSFFNYFNSLTDAKIPEHETLKKIFHPTPDAEPTQVNTIGMEILNDPDFPTDLQGVILGYAQDVKHFHSMRLLCDKKVVKNQAVQLLKEIGLYSYADRAKMAISSSSPEKYLWEHVFQEVRMKCSAQELERIVELSTKERHALRGIGNKAHSLFERALKVTSVVFSNIFVQICVGIYVGYQAYKISTVAMAYIQSTVLPAVINKIINVTPLPVIQYGNRVFAVGSDIYNYRFHIAIAIIIMRAYTPATSRIRPIFNAVEYVLSIPRQIAVLPFTLAFKAYSKAVQSSRETSLLMNSGADRSNVQRIKNGLDHAQNLWVKKMMEA